MVPKGCSYMRNLRTGEAERDAIWDKVSVAILLAVSELRITTWQL